MTPQTRLALVYVISATFASFVCLPFFIGFLQSGLLYQCEYVGIDKQFQCQDGLSYLGITGLLALLLLLSSAVALLCLWYGAGPSRTIRNPLRLLAIVSILPSAAALLVVLRSQLSSEDVVASFAPAAGVLVAGAALSAVLAFTRSHTAQSALWWAILALYCVSAALQYGLLTNIVLSVGILLGGFSLRGTADAPSAGTAS